MLRDFIRRETFYVQLETSNHQHGVGNYWCETLSHEGLLR